MALLSLIVLEHTGSFKSKTLTIHYRDDYLIAHPDHTSRPKELKANEKRKEKDAATV